ncbi:MAG: FAD-dependent oxidoreductase [Candidatus Buchananbacteria bacterium]
MKATLKNRQLIAENTLTASFQLESPAEFKPGQFVIIELINPPFKDAKGSERYFSINNSPSDNHEIIITTRMRDSAFKKSLAEMPLGAEVNIKMIGGTFVMPEDDGRELIFITGGIGITPFMSMLRYANEANLSRKITLLYFNRTPQSTAFLEELKQIEDEDQNFNLILIMTDDNNWQGERHKASPDLIKKYLPDFTDKIYMMAGPPQMVQDVVGVLTDMGIVADNIITENFSGY